MKIQSATITNASGSIGGMTAAKNRGGLYLRARAAVTNPQTAGQTLIRTMLSNVSTAWRTLTAEQRQGWSDLAAVSPRTNFAGDPLILTGHQLYVAWNTPRLQAGLARIDDASVFFGLPIQPFFNAPMTLTIEPDEVTLNIPSFKAEEDEAGHVLIYISKPQSQSTTFFKGPYNLAKSVVKASGVQNMNITLLSGDLPAVAADQVLFVRATLTTDTGRLSGQAVASVIGVDAP